MTRAPLVPLVSAVLTLVSGVVLSGGALRRDPAPAGRPLPEKFRHDSHVASQWTDMSAPEQARDCRGCHVYSKDRAQEKDPRDVCASCHHDQPGVAPAVSVAGSIADTRRGMSPGSPFVHGDHLTLDCRECHLRADQRNGSSVPQDIAVPQGLGWCCRCHDPATASNEARRPNVQSGVQAALNRCERMGPTTNAVFKHEDHLLASELGSGARCDECHGATAQADVDIGEHVFSNDSCGSCHRQQADGAEQAIRPGTTVREFESLSDGTFYHSDHLSDAARKRSATIRDQKCMACHEWKGTSDQREVPEYPLRVGYHRFVECARCHDETGVVGKSRRTSSWSLPDHGDVGWMEHGKNGCVACHVFDGQSPMKTSRPMRGVDRRRPTRFTIETQAHPHMTGPNDAKSAECSTCHLAEVDRIPSKIRARPFDHAPHLPASPSAEDCAACHEAQSAEDGGMIQAPLSGGGTVTYDEAACVRCHKGVERVVAESYEPDRRSRIVFDHNDHVKVDDASANQCSVCHTGLDARAADGRQFGYAKGVEDCRKCHDHDEPNFKRTGERDRVYVSACVDCHERHAPGIAPPGTSVKATRVDVTALDGRQFHPLPTPGQECSTCHRNVTADHAGYPDFITAQRGYEDQKFHQGTQPPQCYACHWGRLSVTRGKRVSEAVIDGQQKSIRGQKVSNSRNIRFVREALGRHILGFPGGTKR